MEQPSAKPNMSLNSKSAILKLRKAMPFYVLGPIILLFGILAGFGYVNEINTNVPSASPVIPLIALSIGAVMMLIGAFNIYGGFNIMRTADKDYEIGLYLFRCIFQSKQLTSMRMITYDKIKFNTN